MANAPAFDPSKPFTRVTPQASGAPAFDPSKPFTKSPADLPGASGGASNSAPAPGPGAPPAQPATTYGAAGQNKFGVNTAAMQKPTFDDFMNGAEAWARGASYGTSDDASAEIAALIMKAKGDPHTMYQLYQALDNEENQRIDQWEAKNGKAIEYAGMVTGPGAIRLGQWIGRGANLGWRALRAATSGAAGAAATDIGYAKPNEKIDPKRTAKAAAIGAAVGPVVQGATEIVAPPVSRAAQYLVDRGVRPTIGQLMGGAAKATEEKAESLPLMGDLIRNQGRRAVEQFNRATYNAILAPLGESVPKDFPIGHEGFAKLDDLLDSKYTRLLSDPRMTFTPMADAQFWSDIGNVEKSVNLLPEPEQKQFKNLFDEYFLNRMSPGGSMDGLAFKRSESALMAQARDLINSRNSTVYDKGLGYAYQDAVRSMRESLVRTNPLFADQLKPINSAYAMLLRVQRATSKAGAKEGMFTPAQFASAVKSMASEKQSARGEALMQDLAQHGEQVLGGRYPDSGSIGRLLLNGGVLSVLGGGSHFAPETSAGTAAGLGVLSLPYLPFVRDWFSSPLAQGAGGILRQINPTLSAQAPQLLPNGKRYIGAQ